MSGRGQRPVFLLNAIGSTSGTVVPTSDSCESECYAKLEAKYAALEENNVQLNFALRLEHEERLSKERQLTRDVDLLKEQLKALMTQPAKKKQVAQTALSKQQLKALIKPIVLELLKSNNLLLWADFKEALDDDMDYFETRMRDDLACVIWEVRDELDVELKEFRGKIITFPEAGTGLPELGRAFVPDNDYTFGAKPPRLSVRDLIAKYRVLETAKDLSRMENMVLDREGYRIRPINIRTMDTKEDYEN